MIKQWLRDWLGVSGNYYFVDVHPCSKCGCLGFVRNAGKPFQKIPNLKYVGGFEYRCGNHKKTK